ncbi:hypothetical protein QF035_000260 [Streptomyces umbrinus]|uniref:Uncharacterized protein n=1 Tax=Streptomyces umbrinus TaxID=67370 RepID=A0ABU0SGI0_9ACTN|nr:hypothetical protein [Streptomyces umbrinus]
MRGASLAVFKNPHQRHARPTAQARPRSTTALHRLSAGIPPNRPAAITHTRDTAPSAEEMPRPAAGPTATGHLREPTSRPTVDQKSEDRGEPEHGTMQEVRRTKAPLAPLLSLMPHRIRPGGHGRGRGRRDHGRRTLRRDQTGRHGHVRQIRLDLTQQAPSRHTAPDAPCHCRRALTRHLGKQQSVPTPLPPGCQTATPSRTAPITPIRTSTSFPWPRKRWPRARCPAQGDDHGQVHSPASPVSLLPTDPVETTPAARRSPPPPWQGP